MEKVLYWEGSGNFSNKTLTNYAEIIHDAKLIHCFPVCKFSGKKYKNAFKRGFKRAKMRK